MASRIIPKAGIQVVGATPEYNNAYRLYDDTKGVTGSGARFANFKATVQRGGIRVTGNASNLTIENLHLELIAPQTGSNLPAGIELGGTVHNVTITAVTAVGFKMVSDGGYTNGDGFSTESQVVNVTYTDCRAINPSDGGYDNKGAAIKHVRSYAEDCYRSYRAWGPLQPEGGPRVPTLYTYDHPVSVRSRNACFWFGSHWPDAVITEPTFTDAKSVHLRVDYGHPDQLIRVIGGTVNGKPLTALTDLKVARSGTGKLAKVTWEPAPVVQLRGFDAGQVFEDKGGDGLVKLGAVNAKKLGLKTGTVLRSLGGTRYEVVQ